MAHFPSSHPTNFNYPPSGYSPYSPSYPSGFPSTFNPTPLSYPGSVGKPIIPVSSIGPSFPNSFQPLPPLSSFVPPSNPPSFSPPAFRPPPLSDSSLPRRVERFIPPSAPTGLPSWATTSSLPPHFSPHSSISHLTGPSPSAYALNPPSLHSPPPLTFSIPSSSFSLPPNPHSPPFFSQPPSLSGRAHYVSSYTPIKQGISPRNPELTVWTFTRSPFLSDTAGMASRNSSFAFDHRPMFSPVADRLKIQHSIHRKFEETIKNICLMKPSPERPFPVWGTVGVSQFAIQINPRTTLFIDPFAASEFFQKISEAQGWAIQSQSVHRDPLATDSSMHSATNDSHETHGIFHQFLEKTAEMQAREVHAFVKYTGLFIKNTFGRIEEAYPVMAFINPTVAAGIKQLKEWGVKDAWENKAIPYLHEKVDRAYDTNFKSNFHPNSDGRLVRVVQDLIFDPMNLMFMGAGSSMKVMDVARTTVKIGTTRVLPESIGNLAVTRLPRMGAGVTIEEMVRGRQIANFARTWDLADLK